MSRYQAREAKRLGLQRAIDDHHDWALSLRHRAIREENIRRTARAK